MKSIIIVGPTGVGKTAIAHEVALSIDGQIINMDMGQLYSELTIGTAKPKESLVKNHLFDVITEPIDYDVMRYRQEAQKKSAELMQAGTTPLFVGGSLFYAQSLFFALPEIEKIKKKETEYTWQKVYEIDPERALSIHKNDHYRIERAIDIWKTTGVKPSQRTVRPDAIAKESLVMWLYREKEELHSMIDTRVEMMVQEGWLQEVQELGELWRPFLKKKKLCGYDVLVQLTEAGKTTVEPEEKEKIKRITKGYAKRQIVFWKRLKKMIRHSFPHQTIIEYNLTTDAVTDVLYGVNEWIRKGNT
jgi:tRNA dimethylallyltransferase